MLNRAMTFLLAVLCFMPVAQSRAAGPGDRQRDAKSLEGLWTGSWGGGGHDGVIFQPVIAELFIRGDHVEMSGFRDPAKVSGTFRLDTSAKQMHITPAAEEAGKAAPKTLDYHYEIKSDLLTLTAGDNFSIVLERQKVVESPLADMRVEFLSATGINDAGNLLVSKYNLLKAGQKGDAFYFQPIAYSLKTKSSKVLSVQTTGVTAISLDAARKLIRGTTPVVVAFVPDEVSAGPNLHELWKEAGSPRPDGQAASRMLAQIVRPGTLVFVLSAKENVPVP
jgi:hypothetical protein